jgi:hypothetical protein
MGRALIDTGRRARDFRPRGANLKLRDSHEVSWILYAEYSVHLHVFVKLEIGIH